MSRIISSKKGTQAIKTIVVIASDKPSDKTTTSKMRKIKFLMGN